MALALGEMMKTVFPARNPPAEPLSPPGGESTSVTWPPFGNFAFVADVARVTKVPDASDVADRIPIGCKAVWIVFLTFFVEIQSA